MPKKFALYWSFKIDFYAFNNDLVSYKHINLSQFFFKNHIDLSVFWRLNSHSLLLKDQNIH